MTRRLEAILRAPKFRNILRVSPARRGFNGARSSGNKLEFLRTSKSRLAPPPPCIRDRYASAASNRVAHLFQFHFITVFESRFTSRQPRETKRDAKFPRKDGASGDGMKIIVQVKFCIESRCRRAYFMLTQIIYNPKVACARDRGRVRDKIKICHFHTYFYTFYFSSRYTILISRNARARHRFLDRDIISSMKHRIEGESFRNRQQESA